MIVDQLYALLVLVLKLLLFALPSYTPPESLGLSVLQAANFVLPLAELGVLAGAAVAYATATLGYTGIMRVVKLLRGAG